MSLSSRFAAIKSVGVDSTEEDTDEDDEILQRLLGNKNRFKYSNPAKISFSTGRDGFAMSDDEVDIDELEEEIDPNWATDLKSILEQSKDGKAAQRVSPLLEKVPLTESHDFPLESLKATLDNYNKHSQELSSSIIPETSEILKVEVEEVDITNKKEEMLKIDTPNIEMEKEISPKDGEENNEKVKAINEKQEPTEICNQKSKIKILESEESKNKPDINIKCKQSKSSTVVLEKTSNSKHDSKNSKETKSDHESVKSSYEKRENKRDNSIKENYRIPKKTHKLIDDGKHSNNKNVLKNQKDNNKHVTNNSDKHHNKNISTEKKPNKVTIDTIKDNNNAELKKTKYSDNYEKSRKTPKDTERNDYKFEKLKETNNFKIKTNEVATSDSEKSVKPQGSTKPLNNQNIDASNDKCENSKEFRDLKIKTTKEEKSISTKVELVSHNSNVNACDSAPVLNSNKISNHSTENLPRPKVQTPDNVKTDTVQQEMEKSNTTCKSNNIEVIVSDCKNSKTSKSVLPSGKSEHVKKSVPLRSRTRTLSGSFPLDQLLPTDKHVGETKDSDFGSRKPLQREFTRPTTQHKDCPAEQINQQGNNWNANLLPVSIQNVGNMGNNNTFHGTVFDGQVISQTNQLHPQYSTMPGACFNQSIVPGRSMSQFNSTQGVAFDQFGMMQGPNINQFSTQETSYTGSQLNNTSLLNLAYNQCNTMPFQAINQFNNMQAQTYDQFNRNYDNTQSTLFGLNSPPMNSYPTFINAPVQPTPQLTEMAPNQTHQSSNVMPPSQITEIAPDQSIKPDIAHILDEVRKGNQSILSLVQEALNKQIGSNLEALVNKTKQKTESCSEKSQETKTKSVAGSFGFYTEVTAQEAGNQSSAPDQMGDRGAKQKSDELFKLFVTQCSALVKTDEDKSKLMLLVKLLKSQSGDSLTGTGFTPPDTDTDPVWQSEHHTLTHEHGDGHHSNHDDNHHEVSINTTSDHSPGKASVCDSSHSDVKMEFEGRTMLKGGVQPRHIPKTTVRRFGGKCPLDPRPLPHTIQTTPVLVRIPSFYKELWGEKHYKKLLSCKPSIEDLRKKTAESSRYHHEEKLKVYIPPKPYTPIKHGDAPKASVTTSEMISKLHFNSPLREKASRFETSTPVKDENKIRMCRSVSTSSGISVFGKCQLPQSTCYDEGGCRSMANLGVSETINAHHAKDVKPKLSANKTVTQKTVKPNKNDPRLLKKQESVQKNEIEDQCVLKASKIQEHNIPVLLSSKQTTKLPDNERKTGLCNIDINKSVPTKQPNKLSFRKDGQSQSVGIVKPMQKVSPTISSKAELTEELTITKSMEPSTAISGIDSISKTPLKAKHKPSPAISGLSSISDSPLKTNTEVIGMDLDSELEDGEVETSQSESESPRKNSASLLKKVQMSEAEKASSAKMAQTLLKKVKSNVGVNVLSANHQSKLVDLTNTSFSDVEDGQIIDESVLKKIAAKKLENEKRMKETEKHKLQTHQSRTRHSSCSSVDSMTSYRSSSRLESSKSRHKSSSHTSSSRRSNHSNKEVTVDSVVKYDRQHSRSRHSSCSSVESKTSYRSSSRNEHKSSTHTSSSRHDRHSNKEIKDDRNGKSDRKRHNTSHGELRSDSKRGRYDKQDNEKNHHSNSGGRKEEKRKDEKRGDKKESSNSNLKYEGKVVLDMKKVSKSSNFMKSFSSTKNSEPSESSRDTTDLTKSHNLQTSKSSAPISYSLKNSSMNKLNMFPSKLVVNRYIDVSSDSNLSDEQLSKEFQSKFSTSSKETSPVKKPLVFTSSKKDKDLTLDKQFLESYKKKLISPTTKKKVEEPFLLANAKRRKSSEHEIAQNEDDRMFLEQCKQNIIENSLQVKNGGNSQKSANSNNSTINSKQSKSQNKSTSVVGARDILSYNDMLHLADLEGDL